MRFAWQRFLVTSVVLTVLMLFFALTRGFVAGYLLALVGVAFIAAAMVNLKRLSRK
jgi:hypothetical protein